MATSALTQHERAERLRSLHRPGDPLVLFNVWDAVSARIVEQLGYPAIATGSAAVAWTQGYPDGQKISRDEMLAAVARITRAVSIPLTADLESAYGFTQEDAAATARGAIEAGAVGLNFEDAGRAGELLDPDVQCERIAAMVQAGQSAGVPLVINARTDVFLHDGKSDAWRMEEAIRRGNRFLQAGADCVFVLGVSDEAAIAQLAREIDGPINVFATAKTPPVARLAELGVARISVGPSGLAHALKYVRLAAQRLRERGTFEFTGDRISGDEIDALFG